MKPHRLPRVRLLALCALCHGCTAIILQDAATLAAPCASVDECASSQRCVDGVCVADDRAAQVPPATTRVGVDGGLIEGPDGVLLEVPQDALVGDTNITISRASATTPVDAGLLPSSRLYSIVPDLPLAAAATLTLPLVAACPTCVVYRRDASGFVPLAVVDRSDESVTGTTSGLGVFVAAEQEVP